MMRDRDLLVSEVEVTSPELDIRFQHAWSMIVLSGAKTLQVEGVRYLRICWPSPM